MNKWLTFFILSNWLPVLFAESCSDIPTVDNSIAVSLGTDEGKKITFTCSNGYQLIGEKTLSCVSSGEWHAPAPTCKAVSSRDSEPGTEDEESGALVLEDVIQTISTAVKSPSPYASVCEAVRKLSESLSCGAKLIEIKSMMEMEKVRMEKLILQQEKWQGTD